MAITEVRLKLDRNKLLHARERLGYGIEVVGEKAGTAKNSVLRAEHEGDIRPSTARKIAKALGVEVADLIKESDYPKASRSSTEPPKDSEGELLLEQRVRRLIADMEADAERWESMATTGEVSLSDYKELKARQVSVQSSANALDAMSKTLGVYLSDPQYRTLQRARQDLQTAHSRWYAARKNLIDLHFSARTEGELAEKRTQREEEEERLEEAYVNNQWFSDVG